MKGIIDRIEENIIVIEVEEKIYNIDKKYIVGSANEGDCVNITIENGEIISVKKDIKETSSRKKYIDELTKNMWQ